MAVKVNATIGTEKYFTKVIAGDNQLIADEPLDKGGGNKGFNPYEILATALASCTAATLRMYIDHKQWEIDEINVEVMLENDTQKPLASFERNISFGNINISDEQKARLLKVAESCPVHKILHNPIEVKTNLV